MTAPHSHALARFVAGLHYAALPEEAVAAARQRILDLVACIVQGSTRPATVKARGALLDQAGAAEAGRASVFGTGLRARPPMAAFMNSFAGSAVPLLEDYANESLGHPSSGVIPAVLALAEVADASWAEVIAGVVAGYEVAVRVGATIGVEAFDNGWHPRGGPNAFGAAAAGARVVGLTDPSRILDALGIAGNFAGGLIAGGYFSEGFYTLTAGAAQGGVVAAQLAEAGLTGGQTILDDAFFGGYCTMVAASADLSRLTRGLGERLEILNTSLKVYPVTGAAHAAAEAALAVVAQHDIRPDDIASIRIDGFRQMEKQLGVKHPRSTLHAGLSLPYIVAVSLADRAMWLEQVDEARLADPVLARLQEITTVSTNPEIDARAPDKLGARVSVTTRGGVTASVEVPVAPGDFRRPMSLAQTEEKAFKLLSPAMTDRGAEALIARIRSIGPREPFRNLLESLPA